MNRRDLLRGLGFTTLGLLAFPPQALSLGGLWPELNQPAPSFELDGVVPEAGEAVEAHRNLADFSGHWLVLYFYPKDFTSGCTLEARGFQRDLAAFHGADAEVVGISADDPDSHAAFCGSEKLAYPLLSDPGGTVSSAYGSWIAPFSARHTFLIDPKGVIRASWRAVRPSGHSQEVLTALQQLQASG